MDRVIVGFAAGIALLMAMPKATLAQLPDAPTGSAADLSRFGDEAFGTVIVYVRTEDGQPLPRKLVPSIVISSTASNAPLAKAPTFTGEAWLFKGIAVGDDYAVYVQASGYQPARETVRLPNKSAANASVIVFLRPVDQALVFRPPTGQFVLAPKAQKEVQRAMQDLQAGNAGSAKKHAEKAAELAPENPYAQYVMGLTYLLSKQLDQARPYLEKSVSIDSRQAPSLLALGMLRYQIGDNDGAVQVLVKALQLDGTSWKAEWYLACSYLQEKKYAEARDHAEQTLKIGQGGSNAIELVLGQALAGLGARDDAADAFETFVKQNPQDANAAKAAKWAEEMRRPPATIEKVGLEAAAIPTADAARAAIPAPPAVEVPPRQDWAPPDVDDVKPFTVSGAVCSLPAILEAAGKNAEELVANLQEFSATEEYQTVEIKRSGQLERPATRAYNYMVFIEKASPQSFQVQEQRDEGVAAADFPGRLADVGVPVMALAFHPMIQGDLEWTCEGLGKWNQRPAWVVHFQQRTDRPRVLSSFVTPSHEYPLALKGRAWISENGGQVLHLETDLMKGIDAVDLKRQHFAIDYDMVSFNEHKMDLWLPASVDSYIQYQGHFLHHYHHFKDFKLFWVGSSQKISRPKDAPPADTIPQR